MQAATTADNDYRSGCRQFFDHYYGMARLVAVGTARFPLGFLRDNLLHDIIHSEGAIELRRLGLTLTRLLPQRRPRRRSPLMQPILLRLPPYTHRYSYDCSIYHDVYIYHHYHNDYDNNEHYCNHDEIP